MFLGAAASFSDEALLAALAPKLDATAGSSHARLAAEALAVGRRGLAVRLLDLEKERPRVEKEMRRQAARSAGLRTRILVFRLAPRTHAAL